MDPSNSNCTTSDDSTMTVTLYRRVLRSTASHDAPIIFYGDVQIKSSSNQSVNQRIFYRNGRTNRAGFWHGSFLSPISYTVFKGNSVISKNKGTFLWNFVRNYRKFCFGISIVETCYRLSLKKVDAQSVINWTVVDKLIAKFR